MRIGDLKKKYNLNFDGIEFPVKLDDIEKFERRTTDLTGINVYGYENKKDLFT